MIEITELSTLHWILVSICALLIGMSKAGLSGGGLLVVPILAAAFGSKPSTGFLLPMLIIADVFAVGYYNRHAEFKYLINLIPTALVGIFFGLIIGNYINDKQFRTVLAAVVILGLMVVIIQDIFKNSVSFPEKRWFALLTGLLGGFTTMIGNAAGPIMKMYLLSMRLPKNIFIGTAAWFFLTVNLVKFPLHIFVWKTITKQTLLIDGILAVPIIAGVFIGIQVVKLFPEKVYRIFIIVSTLLSAIALFFK